MEEDRVTPTEETKPLIDWSQISTIWDIEDNTFLDGNDGDVRPLLSNPMYNVVKHISNKHQTHIKCISNARGTHFKHRSNARQTFLKRIWNARETLLNTLETHIKHISNAHNMQVKNARNALKPWDYQTLMPSNLMYERGQTCHLHRGLCLQGIPVWGTAYLGDSSYRGLTL